MSNFIKQNPAARGGSINTISIETIHRLSQLADLQAIKLKAEGCGPIFTEAVTGDRVGKLIFTNGVRHEIALPIKRLQRWCGLLPDIWRKPGNDLGIEFDAAGQLKVMAGSSQAIFRARDSIMSCMLPEYKLDAGEDHNSEFKLIVEDIPDMSAELKAVRRSAKEQKALEKVVRKRCEQKKALNKLSEAAKNHCHTMAKLASVSFADAIAEAKAFRDGRRFVRRVLANLDQKPKWLSTESRILPAHEDQFGRGHIPEEAFPSNSEHYDKLLAEFIKARDHAANYRPKWEHSRVAEDQRKKRAQGLAACRRQLEDFLRDQCRIKLGCNPPPSQEPSYGEWRTIWHTASSWIYGSSYHQHRRNSRKWRDIKAELVKPFLWARQDRIRAEADLEKIKSKIKPAPVEVSVQQTETSTKEKENSMPSTKVTLSIRQDRKHSVRFDSTDKEAGVRSIYVSRKVPGINEAKAVTLIIEPAIAD